MRILLSFRLSLFTFDFRHFKEKDDRDESKFSFKYSLDGKSINGGIRGSKREGMFTDRR